MHRIKCFSLALMLWGWQGCERAPGPGRGATCPCSAGTGGGSGAAVSLHPAAGRAEPAFPPPPAPAVLKLASFYSQPSDLRGAMPLQALSLAPSSLCPGLHCSSIPNFIPIHERSYKVLAPPVPRLGLLSISLKNHSKNSGFHYSKEKPGKKVPFV